MKVSEFKCQGRGGIGVKSIRFRKTIKGDIITDAIICKKENEVIIVTEKGTLCRQVIQNISTQRRESQGVKIVKLDDNDSVIAMSQVIQNDEDLTENKDKSLPLLAKS